jgi:hypothetical protein
MSINELLDDDTLSDELILYFAAAAKEATGKSYYFMKYAENQIGIITIYYAALDGGRLVLIYDDTGKTERFTISQGRRRGPEPFDIRDHKDVIRAIKHVYRARNQDQENGQHDTNLSL